jgi:glycosyltransferase involved in cell wall biosynthesis
LIPSTSARFVHDPLTPWTRPSTRAIKSRNVLWHTLWSETHSNPRYAELVPRLRDLFFAPIRQRDGLLGRLDGGIARRSLFFERRTLEWYRSRGLHLLLTPIPGQALLFRGPVVVDLDDPVHTSAEQAALRAPNVRLVVVTTKVAATKLRESNPSVDTAIVPQGVDLELVSRARHMEVRQELLARLNLPRETVIVGYHAPIVCLSGDADLQREEYHTFYIDVLLNAVQKLWGEGASFLTVLIGKPSYTIAQLAQRERRLVLGGYVDRPNLFDWIGTFDIGTYPRTLDFNGRQSVKLLEYMANGAAIVAMLTSETEFLRRSGAGYVASTQDDFCNELRNLIGDREARHTLAGRGRQSVAAHDWRALAARYDAILADVVNAA